MGRIKGEPTGERKIQVALTHEQYLFLYDRAMRASKRAGRKVSIQSIVRVAINRYKKEAQDG